MARVIKSTHPTKHYSDGGVVDPATGSNEWIKKKLKQGAEALVTPLAQPSKESNAAGEKVNAEIRTRRDAEQAAEGKRLEAMKPVTPKQKPYTNPDGTPWTREQMRKHLGR